MNTLPVEAILTSTATVDSVAKSALIRHDQRRSDAIQNSEANGLPAITITALQGQLLAIQAQLIGAKSVLEVGTLGGYSTLWFAEQAGCKVTSIELNPKHRDVALQNVKDIAQGEVDIVLGAALEVMPKLVEQGRLFDMVLLTQIGVNNGNISTGLSS